MNPDEPTFPQRPPYPPSPTLPSPASGGGLGRGPGEGRESGGIASRRSDEVRRKRLWRNRFLATAMLTAMGVVFVGTRMVPEPGFWTLLIQAGAEAGMVGGLADWFAVTALFRHPLGVPIPHTAIIPTNKDRIGRTLGRFVEVNFLTPEVLFRKLRQLQVGRRVADWLVAPATAGLIAHSITSALPHLIRSLRSRDLHDFLQRAFGEEFSHPDVAPVLAHAIRLLTASGEADVLFDRAIEIAIRWLKDNRAQLDKLISEHSRWWIPKAIDRRIASAVVDGVTEVLTGLQNPESETRVKFRAALVGLVDDLLNSPEQRQQVNDAARRLLAHPDTRAWLGSIWNQLSDAAVEDLARPESRLSVALEKPVSLVAQTLATDDMMQRHIDDAVERVAHALISWRAEIGSFIAEVVRSWDTRTLVERLELVVGSDLQYIRMNGTIVGACAGCLIFIATRAFS
jgi:uncharacterized membrane-anchored protein YjiN (DUF445 family)